MRTHTKPSPNLHAICIFDGCDESADYRLVARWPDGGMWVRQACLVHMTRGIKSLQDFRETPAGEPTITQEALTD